MNTDTSVQPCPKSTGKKRPCDYDLRRETKCLRSEGCSKRVSFGKVDIREHAMVLGDNPSVLEGPPLTIAWRSQRHVVYNLDDFERMRAQRDEERLKIDPDMDTEGCIPPENRTSYLRDSGWSQDEIDKVIQEIAEIQQEQQEDRIANNLLDVLAFTKATLQLDWEDWKFSKLTCPAGKESPAPLCRSESTTVISRCA